MSFRFPVNIIFRKLQHDKADRANYEDQMECMIHEFNELMKIFKRKHALISFKSKSNINRNFSCSPEAFRKE